MKTKLMMATTTVTTRTTMNTTFDNYNNDDEDELDDNDEQTVTLHTVLFNVLVQMFLLVSFLYAFECLFCFVQD